MTISSKLTFLTIDLGNTDLKFGLFQGENLMAGRGWADLEQLCQNHKIDHAIVSNVASEDHLERLKNILPQIVSLRDCKRLPIENKYATPETLGQDRLCNAVAIKHLKNDGAALSIDLGTCLKFDFVNEYDAYCGGSIAPGMRMRFQALHQFTANLPHIENWNESSLIGDDTASSLVSGVIEGITNEINETIRRYKERYQNLTIFLTGGDRVYFENAINCRIFADPNLTLRGLKIILEANV
jgi:type III pantothenate kinase